MLPHGMTYDAQQAQQVAMPATSTTASSVPVAVVGESGAGSIAASVAAGARRPINHEPGPLQEFLRLHSAFNEPRARAVNIRVRGLAGGAGLPALPHPCYRRTASVATCLCDCPTPLQDSEGMLRWHGDLIKRDPSQANKITMHIKRNSAVLALLKVCRRVSPAACFAAPLSGVRVGACVVQHGRMRATSCSVRLHVVAMHCLLCVCPLRDCVHRRRMLRTCPAPSCHTAAPLALTAQLG